VPHEAEERNAQAGSARSSLPLADALTSLESPTGNLTGALCRARQASKDLHISAKTASRHFRILIDRGFIEPMKKGAFSLNAKEHAPTVSPPPQELKVQRQ
jgi:hypothetical protein